MREAGDEPEEFSGLREVGRPFRFGEDGASADREFDALADHASLDSLDDDSVFLAPKRDFSPAGMVRDEGADADIESPFAELERKTVSELMSPVRQNDGDPDRSQHVFQAKAPSPDLKPVARMPAKMKRPPPLTSPEVLPLEDPSLSMSRPVRPKLVQPAVAEFKPLSPGPRRRPIAGIGNDDPPAAGMPSPDPVAPKAPSPLPPSASDFSFGDDDAVPRRRQIGAIQPETDAAPLEPAPPGRWRSALGALSGTGRALLRGLGTAWAAYFKGCLALLRGIEIAWSAYSRACLALARKLETAWVIYSKGCLALQERLLRRASVHSRSLALYAGSAAAHLGDKGMQGSRAGGASAWKAVKTLERHALDLAKAAHAAVSQGFAHVAGLLAARFRQIPAWVAETYNTLGEKAERRLAARSQRRREAAEAARVAKAVEVMRAAEQLTANARAVSTSPKASSPSLPASKASGTAVTAKPAMVSPAVVMPSSVTPPSARSSNAGKVAAKPTSVDATLLKPRSRLSWGPRRLALAGLAAASIAFLMVGIALSPTVVPASTALTFPIPEKPVIGAIPPKRTGDAGESVEQAVALLEADDPIAEILAHVGERGSAPSISPVLARAGTEEGLSQFVRAAEIVGLKELLEPGESYTIFAPNDEAFAKLAPGEIDGLLEPAGHERLLALLSRHVLPGLLSLDDLRGDVHEHTSLAGETVSIDATEAIRIGNAGMVETDLQAANGVLHVIDQILPVVTP